MQNLDKLLYWRGISKTYINYRGDEISVSLDNCVGLLKAMGVDVDAPGVIEQQSYELDVAPWMNWLSPFIIAEAASDGCDFDLNLRPEEIDSVYQAELRFENGELVSFEFLPAHCVEVGNYLHDGIRFSRRAIHLPLELPLGYHRLQVRKTREGAGGKVSAELGSAESRGADAVFVVVPAQAYTPSWVVEGARRWGLIVQLYTIRSGRNWGIGDFTDLKLLVTEAAKAGAAMIGLNPLHALCNPVDTHFSPYSPSDRRFLNPLYIDPEVEPDFTLDRDALEGEIQAARNSERVAYGPVSQLKLRVLKEMFARFQKSPPNDTRLSRFNNFKRERGKVLQEFCLYQAVTTETDLEYGSLSEEQKSRLNTDFAESMAFHAYLQWIATEQLDSCQKLAISSGMSVGLMRDLAVGANGGGAEIETNLHLFRREAAVGAPPDPLAEKGQNWGLPPMDPSTLRSTKFEHYISLLRANMAHCGALRIDHAMSLMRLWWCPPGHTADHGAYVYYPFRELLGLLKLESVRHQCLVIGEDMGVVPQEFREALLKSNIFTNKLFYFEKAESGDFKAHDAYESHSLAMLTNHDVPTLASWWVGSDLELRQSLHLLEEGADYSVVLDQRQLEKRRLLRWLLSMRLIERESVEQLMNSPMTRELAAAILHGVSQCSSQLFVAQLEDLELLEDPVNVPGTSTEYPNWQRKLAVPLEILMGDSQVQALLQVIAAERRSS